MVLGRELDFSMVVCPPDGRVIYRDFGQICEGVRLNGADFRVRYFDALSRQIKSSRYPDFMGFCRTSEAREPLMREDSLRADLQTRDDKFITRVLYNSEKNCVDLRLATFYHFMSSPWNSEDSLPQVEESEGKDSLGKSLVEEIGDFMSGSDPILLDEALSKEYRLEDKARFDRFVKYIGAIQINRQGVIG